jgi:hypothetical protein
MVDAIYTVIKYLIIPVTVMMSFFSFIPITTITSTFTATATVT